MDRVDLVRFSNKPDLHLAILELNTFIGAAKFVSADVELRCEPQRQVLKGSQRAMKGSVSHIITVGLKDIQTRMLQTNFKVITSAVPDKADLLRRTEEAA